jgi:hypothetical protein
MNIYDRIIHKKTIISFYKIEFIGSLFDYNGIKIHYMDTNQKRDIIIKYYCLITNHVITNTSIIKYLYDRLKLKINIHHINNIYTDSNYITIFNNSYKVEFYKEDDYGESVNPIILTKYEVYKLISHEKNLLNIYDDLEL